MAAMVPIVEFVTSWWVLIPLVALGSLLHFSYAWTGKARWAAVVSAVNESYWEHIKITLWPLALSLLIGFVAGGWNIASYVPAATVALYTVPAFMISTVYGYKAVTGRNVLWVDIAVFVAALAVAQATFQSLLTELSPSTLTIVLSSAFAIAIITALLKFSLSPPQEPDLFVDPLTGAYGTD